MAEGLIPLGMGARSFLRWWLSELQGLVPPALRGGPARPRHVLTLEPKPLLRKAGEAGPHTQPHTDMPDEPGTLWLPDESLLRLDMDLPAAAEQNLSQVLAFEMDRRTPFPVETVLFGHRILSRNGQFLRLTMVAAPRATVAAALAEARALGFEVTRIEPAGGDPEIDLMPREAKPTKRALLIPALQLSAVLLAALAAVLPGERQRLRGQEIAVELAAIRPAGEKAAALRTELTRLSEEARFLAERKRAVPSVAVTLDRLSALLPDDAWASQLRFSAGSLQIAGYAKTATALVPLLSDSPDFEDPRFNAPVTRDERTGAERFDITVDVAGTAR